MKNLLININNVINKLYVRVILALLFTSAIALFIPKDTFLVVKLGKTLLFVLILLCVYFALSIPYLICKETPHDDYDIVDDFYRVLGENINKPDRSDAGCNVASVKVKEKVKTISFTEKNVIIGTVRSSEQLKYNLENNCYYTPARFVEKENLPVKSIAIYEADEAGNMSIKRIGNVKNARVIKRKNIPIPISKNNADEDYWFFELDGWEKLSKPIIVKDTYRGKPIYTNSFLIENCDYSYQLVSINSYNEYILAKAVENFLNLSYNSQRAVKISNKRVLQFKDDSFIIRNNRGVLIYKMPASLYSKRPKQMFDKLKSYIK